MVFLFVIFVLLCFHYIVRNLIFLKFSQTDSITMPEVLQRWEMSVVPLSRCLYEASVNKSICITGAGGSIGKELCFNIIKRKPKILILFDLSELSQIKNLNSPVSFCECQES